MRTEELLNEAKGYKGEGCAYLHTEIYNMHGTGCIAAGEEAVMYVALFALIEAVARTILPAGADLKTVKKQMRLMLRDYKKMVRMINGPVCSGAIEIGGEEDG